MKTVKAGTIQYENLTADPPETIEGEIWYRSDTGVFMREDSSGIVILPSHPIASICISHNFWLIIGTGFTTVYDAPTSRIVNRHNAGDPATQGEWRIEVMLPDDFDSFFDDCIGITTRRSGDSTTFTLTMEKGGTEDSTIDGLDIKPSSSGVFEDKTTEPGSSYSAGDWVVFTILSKPATNQLNMIDSFFIKYNKK